MTGRQEARYKVISVLMVAGFVFSFFAGMTPVNAAQTPVESIAGTGDLYINNTFTINGYDHYIGANVTVDGGTLEIINGSLSFLQDINHTYSLNIINGGRLIMKHGNITDYLDQLHTYPYLRMSVTDSEVVMSESSTLRFPGWLNVTNSYFNMTGSEITSIDDAIINTYVGDTTNTAKGDNANDCPIINFRDSHVYLYDSNISDLFEYKKGDGGFYTNNFNLTLSGNTDFTAINANISIDLSNITDSFASPNNAHIKNFLLLEDTSNAYLYNVSIDESETPNNELWKRDSAFHVSNSSRVIGEVLINASGGETTANFDNNPLTAYTIYKNGTAWPESGNVAGEALINATGGETTATFANDDLSAYNIYKNGTAWPESGNVAGEVLINATGGETTAIFANDDLSAYNIYKNGTVWNETGNYTVDMWNGTITFTTPLGAGDNITADYIFNHYTVDMWNGTITFTYPLSSGDYITTDYTFNHYTVDMQNGIITFTYPLSTGDNITADYYYIRTDTGTIHLFRWANYIVLDNNNLPVPSAGLASVEITNGSAPVIYPSSHGNLSIPPAEVLTYLGKNATNYNLTDNRGEVTIPYLTDIIETNTINGDFIGNYRTYANYTDSTTHTANISFSFEPYPSFNGTVGKSIQMSDLTLPVPELFVSSLTATPAQPFEGDNVTLTATINNTGGSNAVDVNVSFYDGGNYINSTIIPLVSAGGSEVTSINWTKNMTTAGPHVINVTVDPVNLIVEENEANNTYLQQVTVGTRLPDLSVSAVDMTATPATPYAGNEFTVSAVIHNIGDVDASNVLIAFYNGTPDSNGDLIEDLNAELLGTVVINVAASSQTTANITLSFAVDGTYDIYVWADPQNNTQEYSYTNNLAYSTVTILPKPNLEITNTDISFSDPYPDTGQIITITATLHNTGALAVSDNFDVYFFLDDNSSDNIIGIYSYDVAASGNIAPGGNALATITWTANPSGEHTIIVSVNYNRTVDESSYADNDAQSALTVMRTGDTDLIVNDTHYGHLTIDFDYSLSGYVLVEEHGVLEIESSTFTVSQENSDQYFVVLKDNAVMYLNDSTLTSNYRITVYLYDSAKLVMSSSSLESNVAIVLHDSSSLELQDSTVYNSVSMPDEDSAVMLTAANSTFNRAFDNVYGNTLLSLTNVYVPSISLSDTSVARIYRWLKVSTIDGTSHPLSNVTVDTYFPLNETHWRSAVSDENGECLISLLTDTLYGDASREIVGGYMVNGSYVFQNTTYFSGDSYVTTKNYPIMENLAEYQYDSVVMTFDSLKPDLDPPVSVSNSNPVLGIDSVYINTTIWNNGTAAAYDVDVRFYDNLISIGDVYIDKLGVGESYGCSILWAATYPVGIHNISVMVDPNNNIPELNETNNGGWTTVDVIGWPDLTLSGGDISFITQGAMRGGVVTVSATIHNLGDSPSETTQVAFFDGNPEAGGIQFAITDIGPIGIGSTETINVEWIPDSAGNHNIYVVVDPNHNLNETNEDNNVAYNDQYVYDYPDLEVYSITFVPISNNIYDDLNAGTPVDIRVQINNAGQSPAINVLVDLTDITTGLDFNGESIAELRPGTENMVTVTFHWTATLSSSGITQNHTFRAVVDGQNDIPETNEQNNELEANLIVRDPRPDISFAGDVILNYTASNLTGGDEVNISFTLLNTGVLDSAVDVLINASLSNGTQYTIGRISDINVTANNQTEVSYSWTVNLSAEAYSISAIADPDNTINETNENNNEADNATLTIVPPVPIFGTYPNNPHIQNGVTEYNAGNAVTITGTIINSLNQAPLGGITVTAALLDANGVEVTDASGNPVTASSITADDGTYTILLTLPATLKTGDYSISISAAGVSDTRTVGQVAVQGTAAGLSWVYILMAIVLLAAIFIPMLYFKFFGKLGEMVECGACGALIPAGSTKCPKCGVEFETETAKCSVCGAWVPIDASICPECGAVFAPVTEEEEYQQRMHEEYEEEVLNPLKEKAKAELGDEYDDEKFMEWAAVQPEFISFDDWLTKREEEREKMVECPTCGTLNPADAIVCQACGSELPKKEEKVKKLKKKVKKEKEPPEGETLLEEKEEGGIALELDDVLGMAQEKKEERMPAPRKVMKPAPSMVEKQQPTGESKPQDTGTAQPQVRKVVKKPVQKRVVKRPIQTDEKKE